MKQMFIRQSVIYIGIISITIIPLTLVGQINDSIDNFSIEYLTDRLENIAQSSDRTIDFTDLIDDYIYYYRNPVNINNKDISILRDLYLISEIQLVNITVYKNHYGQIYSIYELLSIAGFNEVTVKQLEPFIICKEINHSKELKPKSLIKKGRHSIISRVDRILETKSGYIRPTDSLGINGSSDYLGDPYHYYLRYSYNYRNKVRIGLTIDKDAGELITKHSLNDSIKKLLHKKVWFGADFVSVFAYLEDIRFISKVILGDYHLEFGQGLTLWSGLAFGKSADGVLVQRYAKGLRPNTSANENRFFRGAAMTIKLKSFHITPFYSNNRIDGNLSIKNDQSQSISSIIETGMHRTINELLDKRTLGVEVCGVNITYSGTRYKIGLTSITTQLDKKLENNLQPYKRFRFEGRNIINFGMDFMVNLNSIVVFGEVAGSGLGINAGIIGVNTLLSDRFYLTILYHNYGKDYHNLYCNPIAESSSISNESGIYFGFKALINKHLTLTGYIDHYTYPWLKYGINAPSIGNDYRMQLNITPSKSIISSISYRYKNGQFNKSIPYQFTQSITTKRKHEFRLFISWSTPANLIFKNRIDLVRIKQPETIENGYLIYQDVLYRPKKFPLEITLRYALFTTDGWDSRIYTYENDVLYAFNIPSFFNNGNRYYLMFTYKPTRKLSIWLRLSRTKYRNQNVIGSGNEMINGNHRTEAKVQFRYKF